MTNDTVALITELVDYTCGNCKSNKWVLHLGFRNDGAQFLLLRCANSDCVNKRKKELGVENCSDNEIVWSEFDISGQINKCEILCSSNQLNN